jgi:predicted MFS family arabinose efflux permease
MKRIAYVSCLGIIGILTTEFGVIGILPQIAAYYHISIDRAGLLLSLFALVVGIIGPVMSMAAARYNRKTVMAASLTLFLITGIISSCSPPFWLLLTVRVLPTLLHSAYFASALAAVISTSDKKDRHKMMAIALSGINIATVTTVPLSTYIASIFSWQYSFGLQAVVSAIALGCILKFLPSLPPASTVSYGSQVKILRKPAVWLSLLMCIMMFAGEFAIYSYFAGYMINVKAVSGKEVSLLMFIFGLTGLLGTWIAGRTLSNSISWTNIAFVLGCTIFIPFCLYYSNHNLGLLIFIVGLWGIAYAPGVLIATSSISSAAPEALEFANGLTASFANFGITIGTIAGGWVIAHEGIAQTPWLSAALGAGAIVLVVIRSAWDKKSTNALQTVNAE